MTSVHAWLAAGLVVLAGSASGQQGRPSGVGGLPVPGHEVIGAFEVRGSKHLDVKRLVASLPDEGVLLRLGRPLDSTSICRIREVAKDQMTDQRFPDAVVAHELLPFPPGREHNAVRLVITVTEGRRAPRNEPRARATLRPALRCDG